MKKLKFSILISQILQIKDTYNCDIYDVTLMREYSYREGLMELHNLVSESPDKYYNLVSNGSGIDL